MSRVCRAAAQPPAPSRRTLLASVAVGAISAGTASAVARPGLGVSSDFTAAPAVDSFSAVFAEALERYRAAEASWRAMIEAAITDDEIDAADRKRTEATISLVQTPAKGMADARAILEIAISRIIEAAEHDPNEFMPTALTIDDPYGIEDRVDVSFIVAALQALGGRIQMPEREAEEPVPPKKDVSAAEPHRYTSEDQAAAIARLIGEMGGVQAVADEFGMTTKWVERWLAAGIPPSCSMRVFLKTEHLGRDFVLRGLGL